MLGGSCIPGVKKYFEAKRTVRGIPYISIKSEIKNALTKPYSTQFAFLLYDNGIKNAIKRRMHNITMCHCLVIIPVITLLER
ncbi:hypothetical protein J2749_000288 [Methanobacterium oryzae]